MPEDMPVHLVMDNYATHKTDKVKAWLAAHPRYQVHFTPTSASWLNLIERFFSTLSDKWIKRQAHTSVKDLEESIEYQCHQPKLQPCPRQAPRSSQPPWPSGDDQASAAQSGGLTGLAVM